MLLFVGLVDISAEDEAKAAEAKKKQYSLLGSISPTLRNQIEETTFLVKLVLKKRFLLFFSLCSGRLIRHAMSGPDIGHATRWFHTGGRHPSLYP